MKNLGVPNSNPCTNFDVKSGLIVLKHLNSFVYKAKVTERKSFLLNEEPL